MPGITHWQHQKWFGYFPSVVTFESILGDLYSSSVTNPGFNVSVPASWQLLDCPRITTIHGIRVRCVTALDGS